MDKEFIVYAETKASFEAAVTSGDVDTSQIGIIGETGELWENGEYHPLVESISLARDLTGREEATAEEFIFRASGGNKSIRDESAVIRRIKGNTLVWNQRMANSNFADGTLRWSANNGSLAVNANGSVRFTHTYTGSQSVSQTFTERIPSGHKVLVVMDYQRGDNTAISSLVYLRKASNGYDRFGFPRIGSNARRVEACIITTTDEIRGIVAYPFLNAPAGAYSDIYSINVFDLTQMFGAGNEPSGVSEFKTLFPESCYPYSAPEVRAMRASGIETIGANAFNKEDVVGGVINADDGTVTSNDIYSVANIEVLGNGRYTLTNVANSALTRASYAIYDNDYRLILTGGFADSVRLQLAMSGSVSLPENARYMRVVVHNDYLDSCCVNITHSGALSDATYFKDVRMLPDIIKYFPDGMHSVGDVYDEINADNAIKRCGVRAYEDGDSANGDVITDGATTVYALEEPIMIPIVDALQLDYNVADYGTEKMISTQPSTPFRADIVYKFNAVDRIRDNARNIERLEGMMGASSQGGVSTPSGDPLHYMYELAGAEYNDLLVGNTRLGKFGDVIEWKSKHWLLNELGDITTEEMRNIYQAGYFANGAGGIGQWFALSEDKRTNISKFNGVKSSLGMSYSYYSTKYKTLSLSMTDTININAMTSTFTSSTELEKILTILNVSYISSQVTTPFARCAALKHVLIKGLKVNMPIGDSPLLSNDSILYMIQNSAATSPIVITLHADAYARAMEDEEIIAALAAKPNASLASA